MTSLFRFVGRTCAVWLCCFTVLSQDWERIDMPFAETTPSLKKVYIVDSTAYGLSGNRIVVSSDYLKSWTFLCQDTVKVGNSNFPPSFSHSVNYLYMTLESGLFRYSFFDGTTSLLMTGLPNEHIDHIIAKDSIIVVSIGSQLFKSVDYGDSFLHMGIFPYSLKQMLFANATLFVHIGPATGTSMILRTTDFGVHWLDATGNANLYSVDSIGVYDGGVFIIVPVKPSGKYQLMVFNPGVNSWIPRGKTLNFTDSQLVKPVLIYCVMNGDIFTYLCSQETLNKLSAPKSSRKFDEQSGAWLKMNLPSYESSTHSTTLVTGIGRKIVISTMTSNFVSADRANTWTRHESEIEKSETVGVFPAGGLFDGDNSMVLVSTNDRLFGGQPVSNTFVEFESTIQRDTICSTYYFHSSIYNMVNREIVIGCRNGAIHVVKVDSMQKIRGKLKYYLPTYKFSITSSATKLVKLFLPIGGGKFKSFYFIGTTGAIYRTSNFSANSWTVSQLSGSSAAVSDIISDNAGIYAATDDGVYISYDFGLSWSVIALQGTKVRDIKKLGDYFYLSTDRGVYRSKLQNPIKVKCIGFNGWDVHKLSVSQNDIIVSVNIDSIYRLNNFTQLWEVISVGLPAGEKVLLHDRFVQVKGKGLYNWKGLSQKFIPRDIDTATSVESQEKTLDLTILPNPATDRIRVFTTSKTLFHTLELVSSIGITLMKTLTGEANESLDYEFDVSGLPSGMYTVRLRGEGGEVRRQVAIVH